MFTPPRYTRVRAVPLRIVSYFIVPKLESRRGISTVFFLLFYSSKSSSLCYCVLVLHNFLRLAWLGWGPNFKPNRGSPRQSIANRGKHLTLGLAWLFERDILRTVDRCNSRVRKASKVLAEHLTDVTALTRPLQIQTEDPTATHKFNYQTRPRLELECRSPPL